MQQVQVQTSQPNTATRNNGKRPPVIHGFDAEDLHAEEGYYSLDEDRDSTSPNLRIVADHKGNRSVAWPCVRGFVPRVLDGRPPTDIVTLVSGEPCECEVAPCFGFSIVDVGLDPDAPIDTPLDAAPIETMDDVAMEIAQFVIPIVMARA
jgi:hypothetical protein